MISGLRKRIKNHFGSGEVRVSVWDKYQLVYIRIPKSGNTSVRAAIDGGKDCRMAISKIARLDSSWTAFSFVRNPWSRLVSTYVQKVSDEATTRRFVNGVYQGFLDQGIPIRPGLSFEEFCDIVLDIPDKSTDKHLQSQSYTLIKNGQPLAPFIGRVEKMRTDWQQLMEIAGLDFELPHLNRTSTESRHYSSFYREKTLVNRVAERYADDIRYFNYDFEKRT